MNNLTRADKEESEDHEWQELIDRARTRTRHTENALDGEERVFDAIDRLWAAKDVMLWEIGCKVSSNKYILSLPEHTKFTGGHGKSGGVQYLRERPAFLQTGGVS